MGTANCSEDSVSMPGRVRVGLLSTINHRLIGLDGDHDRGSWGSCLAHNRARVSFASLLYLNPFFTVPESWPRLSWLEHVKSDVRELQSCDADKLSLPGSMANGVLSLAPSFRTVLMLDYSHCQFSAGKSIDATP